jgi:hypothetical protein
MIDTDASQEWKESVGHTLVGTTGLMRGAAVDPGSPTRIYCLPLILSPLSQTSPHRSHSPVQFECSSDSFYT